MSAKIKAALCEIPEIEIRDYFKKTFEEPIIKDLKGSPNIPAESLRVQSQQTEKILNCLLTLRNK